MMQIPRRRYLVSCLAMHTAVSICLVGASWQYAGLGGIRDCQPQALFGRNHAQLACRCCLQMTLAEVVGLAAAVEANSEHPLAAAVLQFAAAHLAVPQARLDAELTAGLQDLGQEPSEASRLLASPVKGQKHSPRAEAATAWLQPATDIEVQEGMQWAPCNQVACLACT